MTKTDKRCMKLFEHRQAVWGTVEAFVDKRDAHGVMDMLIELQILDGRIAELEKIRGEPWIP